MVIGVGGQFTGVIPDVLQPFWTYVLRGGGGEPTWKHTIDSKYCNVETIVADREWRLGFEDRDEAFGPAPDWDYDEPLLHVVRINNELMITIEKYGGWMFSNIYYGDTLLWDSVGGMLHNKVGQSKTIAISPVIEPLTCPYCGAIFGSQEELNTHIAEEHPGMPIYTCPHCGATFSSQAELDAHIAEVHVGAPGIWNWILTHKFATGLIIIGGITGIGLAIKKYWKK